jgi:hypothetical protein
MPQSVFVDWHQCSILTQQLTLGQGALLAWALTEYEQCLRELSSTLVPGSCRNPAQDRPIHDPQVSTMTIHIHKPCPLEGAKHWLDRLLWESVDVMDVFRMKGILNVCGSEAKHILQVHKLLPLCAIVHVVGCDCECGRL